jgi:hypothetical protein
MVVPGLIRPTALESASDSPGPWKSSTPHLRDPPSHGRRDWCTSAYSCAGVRRALALFHICHSNAGFAGT